MLEILCKIIESHKHKCINLSDVINKTLSLKCFAIEIVPSWSQNGIRLVFIHVTSEDWETLRSVVWNVNLLWFEKCTEEIFKAVFAACFLKIVLKCLIRDVHIFFNLDYRWYIVAGCGKSLSIVLKFSTLNTSF